MSFITNRLFSVQKKELEKFQRQAIEKIHGEGVKAVSERTDLGQTTIYNVLNGTVKDIWHGKYINTLEKILGEQQE